MYRPDRSRFSPQLGHFSHRGPLLLITALLLIGEDPVVRSGLRMSRCPTRSTRFAAAARSPLGRRRGLGGASHLRCAQNLAERRPVHRVAHSSVSFRDGIGADSGRGRRGRARPLGQGRAGTALDHAATRRPQRKALTSRGRTAGLRSETEHPCDADRCEPVHGVEKNSRSRAAE